jgi:hypothetical protein
LNVPTAPSKTEAARPLIIILLKFLMVSVSFVSARQPIGAFRNSSEG